MPFVPFSSLVTMARTFNTMLIKVVRVGILLSFLILEENFIFSLLSIMLDVDLSYMAFIVLRYVLSVPTF